MNLETQRSTTPARIEAKVDAIGDRLSAIEVATESIASSVAQLALVEQRRSERETRREEWAQRRWDEVWGITKPALVAVVAVVVLKLGGEGLFAIIYGLGG